MSVLLAFLVAAAGARIESISLVKLERGSAVRLGISGEPGAVAVERSGATTRVSIGATTLGAAFAGGRRFAWSSTAGALGGPVGAEPQPDRFEVEADTSAVVVQLTMPPETSLEVRQEPRAVLLVLIAEALHQRVVGAAAAVIVTFAARRGSHRRAASRSARARRRAWSRSTRPPRRPSDRLRSAHPSRARP